MNDVHTNEYFHGVDFNDENAEPEPDDTPDLAEAWLFKLRAFKRAPSISLMEAARRGIPWARRRCPRPRPRAEGRREGQRRAGTRAPTLTPPKTERLLSVAPHPPVPRTQELVDALLEGLATKLLDRLLAMVEERHDVAQRLRELVHARTTPQDARKFMSIAEYAEYARVSARTIRDYMTSGMVEGEHFLREGRKGRRVTIQVEAADAWRASRRAAKDQERSLQDVAANDIARRLAARALKRTGGR